MTSRIKKKCKKKKKSKSRFKSRLREDADQLPMTVCGFILMRLIVYRVELETGGVLATEHYVLSYVRVALATSDVQSILDIPATDEIHMEDRNHGLA